MASHLYTFVNPTSERDLKQACNVLRSGGVIAYPTDVNWAFGCDPSSGKAMAKINQLKPGHPKDQPFSLICSSLKMVASVGHIENHAYRLLKKCFPGPYTVILSRHHELPKQIKDKRKVVGVRVPDSALLLDLVTHFGKPIATTSLPPLAEVGMSSSEVFGYQVEERFGHGIDLILDLGEGLSIRETSIVDLSQGHGILIREGIGDKGILEKFGVALLNDVDR